MYVCVVGGSNFDIVSYSDDETMTKDSHIGTISFSVGGVGRNIAENLARLSIPTYLLSAVSDDAMGKEVLRRTQESGVDCSNVLIDNSSSTSCYNAILSSNRDLLYAISDMAVLRKITPEFIQGKKDIIANATVCVLDTNIPQDSIAYMLQHITGPKYVVDTVSATKAKKLQSLLHNIFLIKTNRLELSSLIDAPNKQCDTQQDKPRDKRHEKQLDKKQTDKEIAIFTPQEINDCRHIVSQGLTHLVVSLGEKGLWYNSHDEQKQGKCVTLSTRVRDSICIQNTTGAGDAMCAGLVYAMYNNYSMHNAMEFGLAASIATIQDNDTVSKSISRELLETLVRRINEER